MDVCLYSCLSQSAANCVFAAQYYFFVCGLSASNIFFFLISEKARFWGKKFMKMKCV